MTDSTSFELKLESLFQAYADAAPVDVDAADLATSIASRDPRASLLGRWFSAQGLATRLLIAALLLALMGAAVVVGARLLIDVPPPPAPYSEVFEPVGQMSVGRLSPMVIQLGDGRVLIAGGFGDEIPAEIFDPATGNTQRLDGPTPTGQQGSAVQLPDGKVLMIAHNSNYTDSRAWVFEPATASFHEVGQLGCCSANAPPFGVRPGVAALPDGRVLVAGGLNDASTNRPLTLASAMLFDPATRTFKPTGATSIPRVDHSTTALAGGRVLVAGGWSVWPERLGLSQYVPGVSTSSAEIYDPATGAFTPTGSMTSVTGPNMAVALPDGRVLIMSSPVERSDGLPPRPPTAVDIYDPATGQFSALPQLALAVDDAVALRDGRVLLSGADVREWSQPDPQGGTVGGPFDVPWAAIYDPTDGSLEQVPPRSAKTPGIATLRDGTVLFAGGGGYQQPNGDVVTLDAVTMQSVEIFR